MGTVSFKMIFRNWRRNKTFAVISILSLAVGIACINLLAAFVVHEYNVEIGNPNRDRIYILEYPIPEAPPELKFSPGASMFAQITSQVPDIEYHTQVSEEYYATYCQTSEHVFTDFMLLKTDSGFPRVFPQEMLAGNLDEVLRSPGQIAITESFARRLFGRDDPMGKPLQLFFENADLEVQPGLLTYTIGAVLKDRPQAALLFDLLMMSDGNISGGLLSFITIPKKINPRELEKKINCLQVKNRRGDVAVFNLTDLTTTCFIAADRGASFLSVRQTGLLQIALLSALFMLITACINYVNLNFSRIVQQLHSIQVQRMMGADKGGITQQLFADTFAMVLIAFLLSLLIQHDLLPVFNNILSVHMKGSFLYSNQVIPVTLGVTLLLAVISAAYISHKLNRLSLSEYKQFYTGKGKQRIITILAVIQFAIAIGLFTATLSVRQQITLLKDKIASQTYLYVLGNNDPETPIPPLMERIRNLPGIAALSIGNNSALPTHTWITSQADLKPGEKRRFVSVNFGDEGMIETLNLRQIAGIPWEEAIKTYSNPVFVHESYAKSVYPPNEPYPIGHLLQEYDNIFTTSYKSPGGMVDSTAILAGVVEDFFSSSLDSYSYAGILAYQRDGNRYLQIRLHPATAATTLNQIRSEWEKLYPGKYLEITSMYTYILDRNKPTTRMSDLLMMYSLISIFLTCFGLFGMTFYSTEQRTKEIGIRKVNGSTTVQIMWMFIRRFICWIGIAFAISIPVTWYLMSHWLESFVYRQDMTFGICLLAGLIVLGITLLTVSWHSYKAASGNPVNALRSE